MPPRGGGWRRLLGGCRRDPASRDDGCCDMLAVHPKSAAALPDNEGPGVVDIWRQQHGGGVAIALLTTNGAGQGAVVGVPQATDHLPLARVVQAAAIVVGAQPGVEVLEVNQRVQQ